MSTTSSNPRPTLQRVWKSAQLLVGFHRDPDGKRRDRPHVWPPQNGRASIHPNSDEQEVFLVMRSVEANSDQDVQIKLRPDVIVLRRDCKEAWQGVTVDAFAVTVKVGEAVIRIGHDGSIRRKDPEGTTWLDSDGGILKETEFVTASMSADGISLSRRTPDGIAVISESGVLWKER